MLVMDIAFRGPLITICSAPRNPQDRTVASSETAQSVLPEQMRSPARAGVQWHHVDSYALHGVVRYFEGVPETDRSPTWHECMTVSSQGKK